MVVSAIVDEGLGNSAYMLDLGDGTSLVVDPGRDPRPYLGLRPRYVVETHLHADFVSGGRELTALGATLLAPAGSELAFHHRPLQDGDEVDLGGLTLQVIATPGHTPEHLAYLLLDGTAPVAVFTGGTLMAGGVARTDLLSPEATEPLARDAYRSIHDRLLTLPDDLAVYPTHGAGSFCAVGEGQRTTTIGQERAGNPLLAGDIDEDTFVARLLGGLGSYPPYFLELRDVNRAGAEVLGPTHPALTALPPDAVATALTDGALAVDVRSVAAFAAGHVPGSLSIPWRAQFATWLGWLVPRDRPVVFVADEHVDRQDLLWAASSVGHERLVGELAGGMEGWVATGRPLARTELVTAPSHDRRIVDVRQTSEFRAGHVAGALHTELGTIAATPGEVPSGPLLLHCGHGERAMTAASLLERAGRGDVAVFAGGPAELDGLARADA